MVRMAAPGPRPAHGWQTKSQTCIGWCTLDSRAVLCGAAWCCGAATGTTRRTQAPPGRSSVPSARAWPRARVGLQLRRAQTVEGKVNPSVWLHLIVRSCDRAMRQDGPAFRSAPPVLATRARRGYGGALKAQTPLRRRGSSAAAPDCAMVARAATGLATLFASTKLLIGPAFDEAPTPVISVNSDDALLSHWPSEALGADPDEPPECAYFNSSVLYSASLCSTFTIARAASAPSVALERALRCSGAFGAECILSPEVGLGLPAAFLYSRAEGRVEMLIAPRLLPLTRTRRAPIARRTCALHRRTGRQALRPHTDSTTPAARVPRRCDPPHADARARGRAGLLRAAPA